LNLYRKINEDEGGELFILEEGKQPRPPCVLGSTVFVLCQLLARLPKLQHLVYSCNV